MALIKRMDSDKIIENQSDQRNLRSIPPHLPRLKAGWSWVKLGDVVNFIRGVSFPKDAKSLTFSEGKVACLRTANVQKEVDWDDIWFIDEKIVKRDEQFVRVGDILISSANSLELLGKVSLIKQIPFKSTLGTFIVNIRVSKNHNNKYVYYYLTSREFTDNVQKNASTTTNISNISVDKLKQITIRVAPLTEQKKIVEKIEELFSQLDSGVAALKKAKEQLRLYRQSVLAAAFSGSLNQDLSDSKINRIKSKQKSDESSTPVNHGSDNLPNGWKWVKLGEVSLKITDGEHLRPKVQNSGIPFLSAKDVRENDVTFENVLYVSEKDAEMFWKKCNPEKEDILIVSRGATVGRLCIIKTDKRFCLLGSVILIKVDKKVNSSFIAYMIKSPQLNKQIINVSGSTAQQAIYLRDIKNVEIPLPPLSQQTQIVSEIEKRFSEADNLEKAIDESLAKAEKLKQSILKQAFEGKLV